jgi:EAL and modified HD-GYP domain-containing signal transduction protein
MSVSSAIEPVYEPRALVSRQPVVDAGDRVIGYRIEYALHGDHGAVAPSPSEAIDLLDEVLDVIGGEEYAAGSRAFLTVTREMLLHHGDAPPVDPDRVVLRVHHADTLDPAVMAVVARAAQRGYSFLLEGMTSAQFDPGILRHFGTVEFDLDVVDLETAAAAMARLRLRNTRGLAAGVRTHELRDRARSLGFTWFGGPFYMTPNLLGGRPVPVGNMRTLLELSRLQGEDVDLDVLVGLVERDVGLGVRLLRYINSAYFGLRGEVRSVRHAATMLGARGLARWALVAASVGSGERIPREQALLALTRARMCELLSDQRQWPVDPDLLFTIGLLSAVDVIFGMTLAQVVEELSLTGAACDALLHHSGPAGEILASVLAYEHGEFAATARGDSLSARGHAYRNALAWARDALTGTA